MRDTKYGKIFGQNFGQNPGIGKAPYAYIDNTFLPDTLPPMRVSNLLFGISEALSAAYRMRAGCDVHSRQTWLLQVRAQDVARSHSCYEHAMAPTRILG